MTKSKWFFEAQKYAKGVLDEQFDSHSCDWQVITKDKVVESYTCTTWGPGNVFIGTESVIVVISKNGNNALLLMYKLNTLMATIV